MKNDMEISLDEIIREDAIYKQMLDCIPVYFYFSQEQKDEFRELDCLTENNDDEKTSPHGKRKKNSQNNNNKSKKLQLDPLCDLTVSKIQERYVTKCQELKEAKSKKQKKNKNKKIMSVNKSVDSIEDLRGRIQHKIETLRSKRKALGRHTDVERRRTKRQERKLKSKLQKKSFSGNQTKGGLKSDTNDNETNNVHAEPIFNKEGKMVFSKFDFQESKKQKPLQKGKKFQKLLAKVEKDKDKIQKLEAVDGDKAKIAKEKAAWSKAVQQAEGVKVQDDPELLKKSLRKAAKQKQKNAQKWQERNEKVEQKMKEKQDKRKKNINKRKDGRIEKKINTSKKKGRMIPGF